MKPTITIAEWILREIARQVSSGQNVPPCFESPEELISGYLNGESVNMASLADLTVREIVDICTQSMTQNTAMH